MQSELHDHEFGAEVGQKMGMPVDEFVNESYSGLKEGKKDVYVGHIGASSKDQYMDFVEKRAEAIERLNVLMRKMH